MPSVDASATTSAYRRVSTGAPVHRMWQSHFERTRLPRYRVSSRLQTPGRRDWVKVKRHRTVDCVVIGLAGDAVNPALVLGLRHADGVLHHFAVTRAMEADAGGPIADLLATA